MDLFKKLFLVIFLINIFFSLLNAQEKNIPAIVDISWLQKHQENKNLVLIDLRVREEYKKNHIKNAVNIPALKNLFTENFFLPKLDFLKELLSNAGIDRNSLVVAYDNGDFIWSARFYWILETLGHKNISILNVGFHPSFKNTLELSTKIYKAKRKEFISMVDNEKIETKLSTLLAIGKKTIIDGRKKPHYLGKQSIAKRFGHIPSALNYECNNNYQVNSIGNKMKNLDELREVYKNLPKDKEIILYCDGGADAALNYIVLNELGFKASIYDGSWAEWGNDSSLPIDNPSHK